MKKLIGTALALALAACSGSSSSTSTTGSSGSTGTTAHTSGSTGSSGTTASSGSTGTSSTTGSTGTVDPGCNGVSEQGNCNGNTATYCYTGDLPDGGTAPVSFDCGTYFPNNEQGQCATISSTYGVDCEAPTGQPCGFQDQSGNLVFAFCQGTNPGCFGSAQGFTCANSTACTSFADGGFQPVCAGNQLQLGCREGQPVGYDCSSFSGTCSNAQCVNLPRNSPCDTSSPPIFVCGSGLTCTNLPDGGGHACE